MRDITLSSPVLGLHNLPPDTNAVMILYDERGWALRCYDKDGNKITTMVPDDRFGDSGTSATLVPRELL